MFVQTKILKVKNYEELLLDVMYVQKTIYILLNV